MGLFCCECAKALNSRLQAVVGECPVVHLTVTVLGMLFLLRKTLCLTYRLVKTLCSRKFDLRRCGEYAVVTGATDGIGKALAVALAKKGFKIFLISRNPERLAQTELELHAAVPSLKGVKSLAVDFSQGTTESLFAQLDAALKGLDIGVLVNNVGVSYPHAMFYNELDLQTLDQLISVNVRSTLVTTRVVYPGMAERRRGAIICVGSGASEIASDPLYCAYSATKAAAESFCRSLQPECASKNILVQCHVPLLVTTKLSKMRQASMTTPSTETYAKHAVAVIENGRFDGPTTISPYWVHRSIICLSNAIPSKLWEAFYLPRCLSIRRRALKKKEQQVRRKSREETREVRSTPQQRPTGVCGGWASKLGDLHELARRRVEPEEPPPLAHAKSCTCAGCCPAGRGQEGTVKSVCEKKFLGKIHSFRRHPAMM
ncbi:putative 3-ketoacyl-CoA reductase [Besnoitia besnoiti]|uniref:Putative 3-ketoacyl-CoA reductase n=1 Tax=Besnoitia besnoiti TaxID=94643 RepID=A0A2A9MFQ5_BESBE|nr:putative 3-ketoacyl-CoA reductase [Besnoitia besnoiti]PFH37328.1 putative 3-ketoacyl-CoA reductase [Besnoitia besnoiti]